MTLPEDDVSVTGPLATNVERLAARLVAVELEAASLRGRATLLTLGLVVALVALGLEVFGPGVRGLLGMGREVRATSVVLEDASGQARGQWTVDEDGNARLTMLDGEARTRLRLSVLEGGFPGMSMMNADGQSRAAFGILPDETTSLVFADAAGVARAVLGLTGGQAANLVFADADGVSRVGLGVEANGEGSAFLPSAPEPVEPDSTEEEEADTDGA